LAAVIAVAGFDGATGQVQAPPANGKVASRLVVDAGGVVEIVPDLATIRLGVVADADDQDSALLANARIAGGVIARARQVGVDANDIDAGRIRVSPRHETVIVDGQETRGPRIGYAASTMMTVTVRDLPRGGALIRDLLKQGVNVIDDIQFALTENRMSAARTEARAAALQSAQRHAEVAARAAGVRLGRLISIGSPPPLDGAADLGASPEEPADVGPVLVLEPGVIEVHEVVRATWALER
jgi:uncharacterized protein YggE